jgi:hypothetical protein
MSPTRFRCATSLSSGNVIDAATDELRDADRTHQKGDWREIRTLASEETGALNQRLRPLGHPAKEISADGFEPST